jgi:hypothetical protein
VGWGGVGWGGVGWDGGGGKGGWGGARGPPRVIRPVKLCSIPRIEELEGKLISQ